MVDDDPNLRVALKFRLEREKYDVQLAADGLEALEKVRAEQPDAIILDLMMPRMNGLEFLSRLRHDLHMLSIPVIILTAVGLDLYRGKSERLEFADLIRKPFSAKRLVSSVKRALEGPNSGESVDT